MNYGLIKPLQSSGKMEVTPQQSEILQKELFKMGYSWYINPMPFEIQQKNKPYIFWEEDKSITYATVDDKRFFNGCPEPLHLFDNHFKIEE